MFYSGQWKRIFCLVQTISFFPSCGKTFFLTNPSFQLLQNDFPFSGNHLLYLRVLSYQPKPPLCEWKPFFKDRSYSCWWKLIFQSVETIFFHCLRYFSRGSSSGLVKTHFLVQKNKYSFFTYLTYREAYLKLLSLPLATIFFLFFRCPCQSSFYCLTETYS